MLLIEPIRVAEHVLEASTLMCCNKNMHGETALFVRSIKGRLERPWEEPRRQNDGQRLRSSWPKSIHLR